jgi:hypothetical protein
MLRAILARSKFKKMAQTCLPTSQHLSTRPSSAYSNSKNYQKVLLHFLAEDFYQNL